MVLTKIHIIIVAVIILLVFLLWVVDYFWQTEFSLIALKTIGGFLINGLLTVLFFIAAAFFLLTFETDRISENLRGLGLFLIMVGIIGAVNGCFAGAIIGGFNVSVDVGAIIGAGTYLIYFFAFNGMEGRIIDAGTDFRQIMIAIVPAIVAAFAGAVTAGILNYLT